MLALFAFCRLLSSSKRPIKMFSRLAQTSNAIKLCPPPITLASRIISSSKNAYRQFMTSSFDPTRTIWSLTKEKQNLPKTYIPKYLLNGRITRGQRKGGRGLDGRIEIRHKGGGHARNYRLVDFLRVPITEEPLTVKDKVIAIAYDPNRSARIAKVAGSLSNKYKLIIATEGMKPGNVVTASRGPPVSLAKLAPGDAYPLSKLPMGTMVCSVESQVGGGAHYARAAGTYATLLRRVDGQAVIKTNTKTEFTVPEDALAVIGRVSNPNHRNRVIGKAGRSRWLNRRPKGQTGKDRWLHKKKVR